MVDRLNDWLGQWLDRHPNFFFMFWGAGLPVFILTLILLAIETTNPSPYCELTDEGIYYEHKGSRLYSWEEIDHVKLVPGRIRDRFGLFYSFSLSGNECEFRFYDIDEIKTVERLVEENGMNLQVVSLTEEDLTSIRQSYSSDEAEYVIGLFSR